MTTLGSETYFRYDPTDSLYDGAGPIIDREIEYIKSWRGRDQPFSGLALSGGGIRSASFSLGALQALANDRWLPQFDYLSTVSGGGYIGASLSYLLQPPKCRDQSPVPSAVEQFDVSRENFPYLSFPMVSASLPHDDDPLFFRKGRLLRRLRQNANYLSPGRGITLLSLGGVILRNTIVSAVVHLALLILLFQLIFFTVSDLHHDQHNLALWASFALFATYLLVSGLYIVFTHWSDGLTQICPDPNYPIRRNYEALAHYLLLFGIGALVVGVMPPLYGELENLPPVIYRQFGVTTGSPSNNPSVLGTIATLIGVIGNVWGYVQTRRSRPPKIPTSWLVAVASSLLLFGLLLLAYEVTYFLNRSEQVQALWSRISALWSQPWAGSPSVSMTVPIAGLALLVLLLFGRWPDINYLSLHRYYRDRLMEAFLPDVNAVMADPNEASDRTRPGNEAMLADICGVGSKENDVLTERSSESTLERGPYHIINSNVVLVASKNARYRGRGGDNFIFSPLFTGSRATGWKKTDGTRENGVTLATAMAISGAALSPNAGTAGEGITRLPVLSVLMGLLNIRLGYWLDNPDPQAAPPWAVRWLFAHQKPNILYPGLFESFGRKNLSERWPHVLLTDGGHFENLGLYELVRRRLKLIVVCDATADPDFSFADLANAIEKVRADFGAIIDLHSEELAALVPSTDAIGTVDKAKSALAKRGYVFARIRYASRRARDEDATSGTSAADEHGWLIYIKPTVFKETSADLHSYRLTHPSFPNQSTSDQFFDERQFEAYRELGYRTTRAMIQDWRAAKAELLLEVLAEFRRPQQPAYAS